MERDGSTSCVVRHQAFRQIFCLLTCLRKICACDFLCHADMFQYLVAFSAKLAGQETATSVEKTLTLTPIQIANLNAEMEPARR